MGFLDKLFGKSTINKTADASQGSATPAVTKTSKPHKPRTKKTKVEEPVVVKEESAMSETILTTLFFMYLMMIIRSMMFD